MSTIGVSYLVYTLKKSYKCVYFDLVQLFYSYKFLHETVCIVFLPIFKYNPVVELINCIYTIQ